MDQEIMNRRERYSMQIRKEHHQKLRIEIRKTFIYEISSNEQQTHFQYQQQIDANCRTIFKDWVSKLAAIRLQIESKFMNQFEINDKIIQQTINTLYQELKFQRMSPFFLLDLVQNEILEHIKYDINYLQNSKDSLEMSNSALKSILDNTQIISGVILALNQQSTIKDVVALSQTQRSMLDTKISYILFKLIKQDLDYLFVGYEGYIYGCAWMNSYLHCLSQSISSIWFIEFWSVLSERQHFKVKEYCFQFFVNMLNKQKDSLSQEQIQAVIKISINFIATPPIVQYEQMKKVLSLFFCLLQKSRTLSFQYTFTYFLGWQDQQISIPKQKQQIFLVAKTASALFSTLKEQTNIRALHMVQNGCFQWLIPCIRNLNKYFKHISILLSSVPVLFCYKDLLLFLNKFYQTDIGTISKLFNHFPNILNLYKQCLGLVKNEQIKNTILFGIGNLVFHFKELYSMGLQENSNNRQNLFTHIKQPMASSLIQLMRSHYVGVQSKSKIEICIIVRNIIIGLQHVCAELGQQHIFLLFSKRNKGQLLKNLVFLLKSMLSQQYIVEVILNGLKNFKYLLLLVSMVSDDTFETEESYQVEGQLNNLLHQIKLKQILEKLSFHKHTQIQLNSTQLLNFLEQTKGDFHYLS